jgi:hypothetical protein
MRHLFGPALMLALGAMFTWLAAIALEQYALGRHPTTIAADAAPKPALQRTAADRRMF